MYSLFCVFPLAAGKFVDTQMSLLQRVSDPALSGSLPSYHCTACFASHLSFSPPTSPTSPTQCLTCDLRSRQVGEGVGANRAAPQMRHKCAGALPHSPAHWPKLFLRRGTANKTTIPTASESQLLKAIGAGTNEFHATRLSTATTTCFGQVQCG